MATNPEIKKAMTLAVNDNGPAPLTLEQKRFDLVSQGLGHLIKSLMDDHPTMSEDEAVTRLHSFY